jgi:hypothetical protein
LESNGHCVLILLLAETSFSYGTELHLIKTKANGISQALGSIGNVMLYKNTHENELLFEFASLHSWHLVGLGA